jgi:5,5'-dehydrodivanillate O-demethylase oxygenase subunit
MMTAIEQERLVRVGPGTPMGTLLRRYWFPIAAESALRETGRLKVRLLGEDLVLVRTLDGRLGLLDDRCPHRGTSLSRGCVTPFGLRCAYHGWHFDHDGRCIELPGERTPGHVASQVRAPAYRAQSLGGLVFAYLGPEPAPLLPRYDLFVDTGVLRDIGQALVPCNWLQIMENSVDPHHVEWLHGEQLGLERARRGLPPPRYYGKRHQKVGFDLFRHGIIKRRVLIGGSEEDDDWKIGHPLIFPVTLRVGSRGAATFQIRVPVDDTTTWHVWYSCFAAPPEDSDDERRRPPHRRPGRIGNRRTFASVKPRGDGAWRAVFGPSDTRLPHRMAGAACTGRSSSLDDRGVRSP